MGAARFFAWLCTLEEETEVFYKVTSYYSVDHDAGVLWSDPDLRINWPVDIEAVVLSEKDQRHPGYVISRISLHTTDECQFVFAPLKKFLKSPSNAFLCT